MTMSDRWHVTEQDFQPCATVAGIGVSRGTNLDTGETVIALRVDTDDTGMTFMLSQLQSATLRRLLVEAWTHQ